MKKTLTKISTAMMLASLVLALFGGLTAVAEVNPVTPSTNELNKANDMAHVNQMSPLGRDFQFVSTQTWYSCFEYRTDGDTTQVLSTNGGANWNPLITDGLYPYVCVNNSTTTLTITALEYVEVRMVFGAETDERFDWTRFDVLPTTNDKNDCKSDGWQTLFRADDSAFKNQGDCIQYFNTGK